MKRKASVFQPLTALTNVYLAILCSLFLLWPGSNGYVTIQDEKAQAFYWLAGGYLLLMLLTAAELMLIGRQKSLPPLQLIKRASWTQRLVLFYWLLTLFSTLASPYRQDALWGMSRSEGLITISLYCATFLCISVFAKPGQWLGWVLAGTMIIFDGVCLLQMAGYNPLNIFPAGMDYYDANKQFAGIFLGTTGNAGLTAAVLCMTLPLLLGLAFYGKNKLRFVALLPAALNILVLIRCNIQAGLLGMLFGLLLALPVMLGPGRKQRVAWGIVAGILICGMAVVFICPGESGTIYELNQLLHGNFDPKFGNGRIHIWKEVLALVPDNLWLGKGPDTMRAFYIPGLSWNHAPSGATVPLMIDIAHNEYLNILFHQGILALAAYLGALMVSAGKWLKTGRPAAAILGTGVLCYCIQAFFSFSMSAAAALFWALWALLEKCSERTEETT